MTMPVFLRIRLTGIEKEELLALKNAPETPLRTRTRIEVLTLSNHGLSVSEIAVYLSQSEAFVRRTIARWINQGKEGLFEQPRTGRPRKWSSEDIEYLENCLASEERTYNSQQLAEKLKKKDK